MGFDRDPNMTKIYWDERGRAGNGSLRRRIVIEIP